MGNRELYWNGLNAYIKSVMNIIFIHLEPLITAIIDVEQEPVLGQNHLLRCRQYGVENLVHWVTYLWTKSNGTQTQTGTNSSVLSFDPLTLSDAGMFNCTITIDSPYLNNPIVRHNFTRLIIQSKLNSYIV